MRCQNELHVVLKSRRPCINIGKAESAGQELELITQAAALREDETDGGKIIFSENDLLPPSALRQREEDFRERA